MIAVLIALFAKSAVVAGFALAMTALLRRRTAAERADILRAAVLVLLVLPPVALFGPDLALRILEPAPVLQSVQPAMFAAPLPLPANNLSAEFVLPPVWTWLAAVWCLGALLILGRFALGLMTLARWSRTGRRVDQADWLAVLRRLAPSRQPKLRVTPAIAAPLSWGLSPGRILIGLAQLDRPDQAEAVLAHELAHIRRADWLFLALSRVAVALFWFNPLVWMTARELERLSEQAVDEAVVRCVDREIYARTLVGLAAQITRNTPAHGAAAGMTGPARSLAERIKTVMSDRKPTPSRPWLIAGAVAALAAVATPIAAIELTNRVQDEAVAMPVAVASATAAAAIAADADAAADTAGLPAIDNERNVQRTVITNNGRSTSYVINDGEAYVIESDGTRRPMTDAERAEADEARAEAHEAARHAREAAVHARAEARIAHEEARAIAAEARAVAQEARAHARIAGRHRVVDRAAIREQIREAHMAADEARAIAGRHRVDGERIRRDVERDMARMRIDMSKMREEMARGADQMVSGAQNMREEADRLRDPAYRARKIEEKRLRGEIVTDQELIDAIPQLRQGADQMERGAAQMRASSRGRD